MNDGDTAMKGIKWHALWWGIPQFPLEHFFTVDQTGIWRRHMFWANSDGEKLRNLITQRFASNVVFLSLLLSAEIGVFFSPSAPLNEVREDFENDRASVAFAAGVFLAFAILFTISAFMANFTAWSIISSVAAENVHSILRSSLGLYASTLPSRLIVVSIYLFFIWIILFFWVVISGIWALALTILGAFMLIHVMSTYSALGRVILHTGAMSRTPVLLTEEAEVLSPQQLHDTLAEKTATAKSNNVDVMRFYRMKRQHGFHAERDLEVGDASSAGSGRSHDERRDE